MKTSSSYLTNISSPNGIWKLNPSRCAWAADFCAGKSNICSQCLNCYKVHIEDLPNCLEFGPTSKLKHTFFYFTYQFNLARANKGSDSCKFNSMQNRRICRKRISYYLGSHSHGYGFYKVIKLSSIEMIWKQCCRQLIFQIRCAQSTIFSLETWTELGWKIQPAHPDSDLIISNCVYRVYSPQFLCLSLRPWTKDTFLH